MVDPDLNAVLRVVFRRAVPLNVAAQNVELRTSVLLIVVTRNAATRNAATRSVAIHGAVPNEALLIAVLQIAVLQIAVTRSAAIHDVALSVVFQFAATPRAAFRFWSPVEIPGPLDLDHDGRHAGSLEESRVAAR